MSTIFLSQIFLWSLVYSLINLPEISGFIRTSNFHASRYASSLNGDIHGDRIERITMLKKIAFSICVGGLVSQFSVIPPVLADQTLQDQLKVIQVLQVQQQKESLDTQLQEEVNRGATYEIGDLLARGVVTLPPPAGADPTQYPLGLPDAGALDSELNNDKAVIYLTAVGREGPPVAAKRFLLNDITFPFRFEITTNDLLFPYTPEAWRKASASSDTVAVTCILDADGSLTTPSAGDRFGFAISDPEPLSGSFQRSEAKVSVNLKSDGRPYSEEEMEVLSRLDRELSRLEALRALPPQKGTTTTTATKR
eukprot:gene9873-20539_t